MPAHPDKKQLNLWVWNETYEKLTRLAPAMHLRGRTQVAEFIIEDFLSRLDDENGGAGGGGVAPKSSPPSSSIRKGVAGALDPENDHERQRESKKAATKSGHGRSTPKR